MIRLKGGEQSELDGLIAVLEYEPARQQTVIHPDDALSQLLVGQVLLDVCEAAQLLEREYHLVGALLTQTGTNRHQQVKVECCEPTQGLIVELVRIFHDFIRHDCILPLKELSLKSSS